MYFTRVLSGYGWVERGTYLGDVVVGERVAQTGERGIDLVSIAEPHQHRGVGGDVEDVAQRDARQGGW
jgi:hypothetical protein